MTEKVEIAAEVREALTTGAPLGGVSGLEFTHVDQYTTFNAEWARVEEDYVFHFFPTPEVMARSNPRLYWETLFPKHLDPVAQEVFQATFPRLQATFVPELNSWWMRAYGFSGLAGESILPERLFARLDAALDADTTK